MKAAKRSLGIIAPIDKATLSAPPAKESALQNLVQKYKTPLVIFGIGAGAGLGVLTFFAVKKKIDQAKLLSDVKNFSDKTFPSNSGKQINIVETAKQIGIDMGVEYSWYNPQSWTENDDAARDLLLDVPKELIPQIAIAYAKEYGRNMQQDLQKYLDDYDQVRHLFL